MKIRHPLLLKCFGVFTARCIELLMWTVRIKIHLTEPDTCCYYDIGERRVLYSLWHDGIVGLTFGGRPRNMAALASFSADGAWAAYAIEAHGLLPIRGSSTRGGAGAMRRMLAAAEGRNISITTDGPRGPRREVKSGIVFLASHSGRPVIPLAFLADNAWKPKGRWTDMVIPKPFSTAHILAGPMISIPSDLSRNQLNHWRQLVQDAMDNLEADGRRLLRGEIDRLPNRLKDSESRAA